VERLWNDLINALTQPKELFARLRESPSVLMGIVIPVVAQAVSGATGGGPVSAPLQANAIRLGPMGWLVDALAMVALLLVGALIIHGVARMLGGDGSYAGALSALGFASTPILLYAPFLVVSVVTGWFVLAALAQFVLNLWSLILDVIAVRTVYRFSTARAVGALLLGFIGIGVVGGIAMIIVLGATVATEF